MNCWPDYGYKNCSVADISNTIGLLKHRRIFIQKHPDRWTTFSSPLIGPLGTERRLVWVIPHATAVGLSTALFGPVLLFTHAHKLLGEPEHILERVLELLFLWILAGSIVAIVVWWEKLTIRCIGLRLAWQSVFLGLLLALFFNRAVVPFLYWMIRKIGTCGFEIGPAKMVTMPVWFLLFAAFTAGVVFYQSS